MTDTSIGGRQPRQEGPPGTLAVMFGDIARTLRSGELTLAIGVLLILVVLIMPMPPLLLDMLLAVSIILSVLVLMAALFTAKPLEFSAFPTVLLIATILRLALNLASTRLILSHGHEGPDAAGEVIEAFGSFIMGGNFVIGVIVFAILVIVNFIVITKGSGRIAEVAARFSLDAMPGKQMAIDADLNAGIIDQEEAKRRRRELEDESSFFGSMDGASKFVRGDAIAGLIITFINIIGGIIIGVAQMGLPFAEAAQSYTVLTVGDGLVTQIPALIVSVAAGLLVTKAGVTGTADKALAKQLAGAPKALGMASAVMVAMALLPGIPPLPFLALAAGAGWFAFRLDRDQKRLAAAERARAAIEAVTPKDAEETMASILKMDEVKIEIGYAILPLVSGENGHDKLTEQIKGLRRNLAGEMGFVMPSVRLVDNVQLEANQYVIRIKEVEAGVGVVYPNAVMVMDPNGGAVDLPGQHTMEPTFGLPATWVEIGLRDEAQLRGYTVVDASTVIATHLTEVIKANMSDLLSFVEVQKLLRELPKEQADLVKEISPAHIATTGIQRVLQLLLAERVSIRDLGAIVEAIAEVAQSVRDPRVIVEHVRSRLARQICAQNSAPNGQLPIMLLSPTWEDAFAASIAGEGEGRHLAMKPTLLQDFVSRLRERFEDAARMGDMPVLVTSAAVRPFVRQVVERFRTQTAVISQAEIHPRARLKSVGNV
jgi:flagellar biosynthesis protein FlhA